LIDDAGMPDTEGRLSWNVSPNEREEPNAKRLSTAQKLGCSCRVTAEKGPEIDAAFNALVDQRIEAPLISDKTVLHGTARLHRHEIRGPERLCLAIAAWKA
jgi:hypothetical protein